MHCSSSFLPSFLPSSSTINVCGVVAGGLFLGASKKLCPTPAVSGESEPFIIDEDKQG
jgi:hypothetical protein